MITPIFRISHVIASNRAQVLSQDLISQLEEIDDRVPDIRSTYAPSLLHFPFKETSAIYFLSTSSLLRTPAQNQNTAFKTKQLNSCRVIATV